ncbi:hypothetical protein A3L09_04690 [Thermococcus profundus]|uniref:Rubrerythrin diiron-binding domain-containing protein n=1 Tax=Thermococcus profundus TaxID=49899 RepID=A0A2Z2MDB4_THEPR|nr:hypothetical protein [Thermococcus profundus]ASJ02605.1 hypothetical protein A3L09_04690 [Thermococcus profundus]
MIRSSRLMDLLSILHENELLMAEVYEYLAKKLMTNGDTFKMLAEAERQHARLLAESIRYLMDTNHEK